MPVPLLDLTRQYKPLREAMRLAFGVDALPRYDLAATRFLVSVGDDFLESGPSPVEYHRAFARMSAVDEHGTKGRFVLEDMCRELTLYSACDFEKRVYSNPVFGGHRDFEDTFRNRIHKFLEEVTNGVPPDQIDGSGADGLAAQKVLHAAIESLQTESIIKVDGSR